VPDNQTHDEWLSIPSVAGVPDAKGTGVVFRAADGGKEYINNVEYEKFLEQADAEQFDSYSWVPHAIANEQQVLAAATSCKNYRCVGKCPPGCICNRKNGRCK
jgi:hypothetical protein